MGVERVRWRVIANGPFKRWSRRAGARSRQQCMRGRNKEAGVRCRRQCEGLLRARWRAMQMKCKGLETVALRRAMQIGTCLKEGHCPAVVAKLEGGAPAQLWLQLCALAGLEFEYSSGACASRACCVAARRPASRRRLRRRTAAAAAGVAAAAHACAAAAVLGSRGCRWVLPLFC